MNNNTYQYMDNGAAAANPTDLLTNLQPGTFGLRPLTFGIAHLPNVFHDDIFRCAPTPFGIGQIPISKYRKPLGTQTGKNTATHLPIGNPQNPIDACRVVIVSKQKPIGMHQPPIGIIEKPIVNPRLVFLSGHLPNGNRREICTCTSKTNGSRQIPNSAKQKTIGTGQNIIVKSTKTVPETGIPGGDRSIKL
ncbi:hypothetical protein [Parapedobacter tibetensis]|uniref:hypothetical protein n=1 Tax=Parapedobacter tibetensis TaxID=2972951 RepID=UPI00214D8FCD|nr:hypothetical protein [Parapedobacter tibetensis]